MKVTGPKGEVYDKHGKVIERTADVPKPGDTPEAHIPIDEFDPRKFPKPE